MTTSTHTEQKSFVHSALLYHSERECLDFVARVVTDGWALGEPVMVALPVDRLVVLRSALPARAGSTAELRMVDITAGARNPSRFLAMESAFAAQYGDRRVRIVSQLVWPGRTSDECVACVEHEALVNEALEDHSVMSVCLYDAQRLEGQVLAEARATHPVLWKYGSAYRSADYAPDQALARCNQPLPANPGAVTYTVRAHTDLRPARSFAADYAGWVGLSQDGVEELQLIATELATNSLLHTGGACQLAFWRYDDHLVCEARDGGQLEDPLAGRRPPSGAAMASRGLFLVNAMADLVRTHTTANGTTIQAYLRLKASTRQNG